jgi:ribose transport system permease protein
VSPTIQIIGLPRGVQDIVVIFVLALAGRQALTRRTPPEPPADDANPAMQPSDRQA